MNPFEVGNLEPHKPRRRLTLIQLVWTPIKVFFGLMMILLLLWSVQKLLFGLVLDLGFRKV